jgi:hypothetical protein
MQAVLAGAVLANASSVSMPGVKRRFAYVGAESFPGHCALAGVITGLVGLAINGVLFGYWLADSSPPLDQLGLASLSQSLIIIGSTLATFGLVSRFVRARWSQEPDATPHAADDRTPTTAAVRTARDR